MTGSVVTSEKPVFVTSGSAWSSVGVLYFRDHLVATLPPVERLGTHYIIGASRTRTSGDAIKITGIRLLSILCSAIPYSSGSGRPHSEIRTYGHHPSLLVVYVTLAMILVFFWHSIVISLIQNVLSHIVPSPQSDRIWA
jgi:hypothetical protein